MPRWKVIHAEDVIRSFQRDLFAEIGGYPIGQIDEGLLLHALRKVEARGSIETARRLRQQAERVFRFAAGAGVKNSNPAVNVRDALKPTPPGRRWPALTDIAQIRLLIRDVDRAGASSVTRLCSQFLGLTAQRPGMVRHAKWQEIEGVDRASAENLCAGAPWRFPAAKMKQELALREDEAFEHVVPLSAPPWRSCALCDRSPAAGAHLSRWPGHVHADLGKRGRLSLQSGGLEKSSHSARLAQFVRHGLEQSNRTSLPGCRAAAGRSAGD